MLSRVGTGLATVQALARGGVDVHAFYFDKMEAIHYSHCCKKVFLGDIRHDETRLLQFLIDYAVRLGNHPVVFPTCDSQALLLAQHRERLATCCTVWTTDYAELARIVNKQTLYAMADSAGVATIPAIYSPSYRQAEEWSTTNPCPYLMKPSYEEDPNSKLHAKNLRFADRDTLLHHIKNHEQSPIVLQRLLRGGDGFIFDCYGLCDKNGQVMTIASHRRWRQHHPDFGATCYGEIPANIDARQEALLFANTERLLKQTRYHGIFGIEWLLDQSSGKFYLIDFNARPFVTIGHLHSCGLNLPLVAYRDLIGQSQPALEKFPKLKTKLWVDLRKDIETFNDKRARGEITATRWLRSLLRCRSVAYFDWRDPGPAVYVIAKIISAAFYYLIKRAKKLTGQPQVRANHIPLK